MRVVEGVSGRSFEVHKGPEETLRAQYQAAADPLQQSFAALILAYAQGNPIEMKQTLETFPVPLVSVTEYARRVLHRGTTAPP